MPNKPVAVVFSDSHLSIASWADAPGRSIRGDSFFSFQQVIDFAIKYKVEAVVAAGDLLDKALNRSAPVVFLHQQLDRLQRANVAFWHIQGNHDWAEPSWFDAHQHAQHLHLQTVQIGPYNFWGLDFVRPPLLQTSLAVIPEGTDVLIAHQMWAEFDHGSPSAHGSFADVYTAHTMITGDFHNYRRVEGRGADEHMMTVYSPGATRMTAINEEPDKYFLALMDDGTFRKVRLKTRSLLKGATLISDEDVDMFVANTPAAIDAAWTATAGKDYPDAVRKPLLVVNAIKDLDAWARVKGVAGDMVHLFYSEVMPAPGPSAGDQHSITVKGRAATLKSAAPAYLAANRLEGLAGDVDRLLDAEDVASELARMCTEALNNDTQAQTDQEAAAGADDPVRV